MHKYAENVAKNFFAFFMVIMHTNKMHHTVHISSLFGTLCGPFETLSGPFGTLCGPFKISFRPFKHSIAQF